jgi:hypothetical protein
MNLRRVVGSKAITEYASDEILTACNQLGEIPALLAIKRNNRHLRHVGARLHAVALKSGLSKTKD